MNFIKLPYFSSVLYVLNFKTLDNKVRFKQGEVETAFSGFLNGQSQQTNVPDQADPTQARIIFGSANKTLGISQVGCQLQMDFSNSDQPIEKQLEVIRKNVLEFYARTCKVFTAESLGQSGFVVDLAFASSNSQEELNTHIATQFYKGELFGKVASAQFSMGYEIDELFLTLSTFVYELRSMEIPANAMGGRSLFNIDSVPVTESGLGFKIDANDRPLQKSMSPAVTAPDRLLAVVEDFILNKFTKFSGLNLGAN